MDFNGCKDFLMETAKTLLAADSPSGFTQNAVAAAERIAGGLGYATRRTNKGGLVIEVPGREHTKRIGLCAHVDTLGLMCRAITDKGELMITRIGGPILPTLDGEYCKIYTRDGRIYTGTVLSLSPAAHVFDDVLTRPRDEQNMAVRIDEKVQNADEVRALGIEVGDYICFDPKTTVTQSGFLKSRFIDDKGSAACLLALLKLMRDAGTAPRYDTEIHFTVYEEVGHGGASSVPKGVAEAISVDMGCVGDGLSCKETQVSICAKDSNGPYHYDVTSGLIAAARRCGADFAVDVYPHYGSDVEDTLIAGWDVRHGLIGPGVYASHGYERSHVKGAENTLKLLEAYLSE